MRSPFWIIALLGGLGIGHAIAQPVTIRTFGYGDTAAVAIADGRRQILADAREAVSAESVPGATPMRLGPVRVVRAERLASGRYEAELVAKVTQRSAAATAIRPRIVLLLDPRAQESLLGLRVLDEAKSRLLAGDALVVPEEVNARLLLDRLRDKQSPAAARAPSAFELLFVLAPETFPAAAGKSLPFRVRVTVIDAATEKIRSVTTTRLATRQADALLVQETGCRVAAIAREQAGRYVVRPRMHNAPNGIILDSDW